MRRLELGELAQSVREHAESTRGMALHYMTLYAIVLGMEAQSTLEFGAGVSTSVFLSAHRITGGVHQSISTERRDAVVGIQKHDDAPDRWIHHQGTSSDVLPSALAQTSWIDVVLHDGSHATDVVEADLRAVLPQVAQYGLILVHDTQHSYVGPAMRQAVGRIIHDFDLSHVTLPYGFGLTILRNEVKAGAPIAFSWRKYGSSHWSVPCRVGHG